MAQASASAESASPSRAGGLAVAAAVVAFGFVGSRLLGVVRTIAIADAFGSTPELSAFNVASRVPDFIFQVLAGATLGSAFIPVFARLYRREGDDRAWRLASSVLNLVTAATAALCLVAFVLAPVLVPLTAPGLGKEVGRPDELTAKAVSLTRLMLLSPLLFAMSGMVTGILNARQRFFLSALAPMLYNLSIIFGAVVLSGPWGVEGLAAGTVAGAGLHLAIQVPGLVRERMRYRFSFDWRDSAVGEVRRLMGPRVIGLAAVQFNFVITTYFASKIDDSAIANLTYAWLLVTLPLAVFGMSLSTAVFPRLAEHAAADDHDALHAELSRVLRFIMFFTIPSAVGLALLRQPATVLLLQRGEFTAADAAITASALGFYCLGLVPMAGIEIHSRGFYALGDTRTPVALAVLAVVANGILSALLWKRFEHEGLAFSVAAASWLEWVLLYAVHLRRSGVSPWPDLSVLARCAFSAAMMGPALSVVLIALDKTSRFENAVVAVGGSLAGGLVYAGMARWFGLVELREASGRLRGLFARSSSQSASLP